ncbi:hypothetical protein [Pseudomonas vancouverensis]|uniref:Uncharacterized protein n=1 Tax=Pseudomonas vancouverensis TaxID=95300 RepID=A0A1H2MVT3_PSEVA|nr:hypothetical protein [Pseudomonas vancouverensis]KAB0489685.1 hypothetical protein F7R09_28625 [Pseudomonas vancouverensis]TDB67181.1 hypothetical protein EIY72_03795 [Pseudomonas vancouverensis]SDU97078.1 hypothetical protein SAMN05216558_1317 [Pseudomonas vancouverensis]
MKSYLVALIFLIVTPAIAASDNAKNQIDFLDTPYAVTHLSDFDIDCVWTKDDQGRLKSEAMGPDGPGVCWDKKSVDQVRKLDEEGKLTWHNPTGSDHTGGNESERRVEFGGYVATKNNLLGSVLLACYTGSLDSDGLLVSKEEQENRYMALLGLYEGEPSSIKKVTNAYSFARRNLSDRYPLDTRGQYRAAVCDQMVKKGKL